MPLIYPPHQAFYQRFDTVGPWVVNLFTVSLQTAGFPSFLKHATVKPRLKKIQPWVTSNGFTFFSNELSNELLFLLLQRCYRN